MTSRLTLVSTGLPPASPPDASDGAALLARAQAGDAAAFEAIYRAESGRVFAICLRLTANRQEAAELTQDTFVRVWEKLPTFRGESQLGTWIHRIAVHRALERRRAESRRLARVEPVDDPDAFGGAAPTDRAAERLDLDTAVARLNPTLRTVFVLHDVEGYDYREISALTGATEVALRSQLHRARKQMMELLRL